eukprot:CAMPEP_0178925802 /NCGR_PEP_ID=MMETSP0786-20121207/18136_1 /TAXON_ID=186022 /ORGANISM="Thalassionema frauenfeldii, Strain CCMP 1798" /LENGTH=651 /DNA_ID=CAMNT_0020600767 /DNA_START=224 /DNA_END=2179 /DNA_ORIENTATION=+
MDKWYDKVDDNATPDDVFWEEQERQRLLNQLGGGGEQYVIAPQQPMGSIDSSDSIQSNFQEFQNTLSSTSNNVIIGPRSMTVEQQMEFQRSQRTTEATLQEYESFRVKDNWINSEYVAMYKKLEEDDYEQLDLEEQDRQIEEQFQRIQEGSANNAQVEFKIADSWKDDAEPWDLYGKEGDEMDLDRGDGLEIERNPNNEFESMDDLNADEEERRWQQKVANCQVSSKRLEKARDNPTAYTYFHREPDALEGYDTMWVCAVDNACLKNLAGVFRNYGVEFADNFGDFENTSPEDERFAIEDLASFKARQVFNVTGLPVITSQTSFEIEPVPPSDNKGKQQTSNNVGIASGYWFNNIGEHVDHMIDALKPVSTPDRKTLWRTCLCFYDGDVELYEFSTLECDLHFATSLRTFIPVAQSINQICKTLQLTFGLEYMKWLKNAQTEANSRVGRGTSQLRDRILKDGKVLPNNIIDVSSFMDSMIDVNLMDDCAQELAERFMNQKPNKILTVATTGLVIALPLAKYLQIPVVYARKERSAVMADTYSASYRSTTVGKGRQLLVSKSHLSPEDRILVVDDFLSSGAAQEALLRIISDADAKAVGVGVLLEKVYGKGRLFLSGFNIPIHSMCRVSSVQGGVIQVVEEGEDAEEKTVVY